MSLIECQALKKYVQPIYFKIFLSFLFLSVERLKEKLKKIYPWPVLGPVLKKILSS